MRYFTILFIMVITLFTASFSYAQGRSLDIQRAMSPDQFQAYGLDKLTPDELAALNQWFTTYTMEVMRYAYGSSQGQAAPSMPGLTNPDDLEGAAIVGGKGQFLGIISSSRTDPNSIGNSYSVYGSDTTSTSIFNRGNIYGSRNSPWSAFNINATSPPRIYVDGVFVAFLTTNPFLYPRVDPYMLIAWIGSRR